MDTVLLEQLKTALREIVADNGFVPDQEAFELFHKIVPWPAVEVGVFKPDGELLLHHRHFKEWPGEFGKIHGWYVPGGYIKPGKTLAEWCRHHLEKDGVVADVQFVGTCGVIQWMPGEHPFSNLISLACVCLLRGELKTLEGEEENFRFFGNVVDSPVPHHTELQRQFFTWRNCHPAAFK